jgi:hypothetical protein
VHSQLSNVELAALGLAHVNASGRHCSEGHERFVIMTHWADGVGRRKTLDMLAAQLREVHMHLSVQMISALLNRTRAPSLELAGAIERAFGIPAIAWTISSAPLGVDREFSTSDSEEAKVA